MLKNVLDKQEKQSYSKLFEKDDSLYDDSIPLNTEYSLGGKTTRHLGPQFREYTQVNHVQSGYLPPIDQFVEGSLEPEYKTPNI